MVSDIHYERALLACLCQFGLDAYSEIEYLDQKCFSDQSNSILFDILKNVIESGSKPDIATILSRSNELGFGKIFEKPEEISYLRSLFNFPALLYNTSTYGSKLKKINIINDLNEVVKNIQNDLSNLRGDESIEHILNIAENPINNISSKIYNHENNQPIQICDDIENYVYEVLNDPLRFVGLQTGFDAYDYAIGGGLRRAGVDVVAGRPKSGKSSIGLQIALNLASVGIPVLIVDTEMNITGQKNRVIANQSNVDINEFTSGQVQNNNNNLKKIIDTSRKINKYPLYHINVSGKDFKSICSIMRNWIKKHVGRDSNGKTNDCLIVYDYLKLTTSDDIGRNMQEYQALGFQMTELYNFMVKYDSSCLAFVQLNRELDVSQSDRIKWLCTSFSKFLNKSDEEMADDQSMGVRNPYNRKIEVEVCRFGPGTEFGNYINVRMQGKYCKVDPGPTRNELQRTFTPPDIATAGTDTDATTDDEG